MPEPVETAAPPPPAVAVTSSAAAAANGQTVDKTRRAHKIKHPHAAYVLMLDGQNKEFKVDKSDLAEALYKLVIEDLELQEPDYFALSFIDADGKRSWLYKDKRISKQVAGREWQFNLQVKFYPTDPTCITDDQTRYQLTLQVQRDVASGRLPCSMATAALLGSLMVQSTLCDFDPAVHTDPQLYLAQFSFAPTASRELNEKVHELFKMHKGQTQAEADLHYLENACKLNMYGVDLHNAKDADGKAVQIGVCASGINVYHQQIRTARYVWPKIFKISYRGTYFKVKLRPGEYDKHGANVLFKLPDGKQAKRVWKSGVEHHGFFRLMQPEQPPKRGLMRFGSTRFRYTGRTQFQSRMNAQMNDRPAGGATVQRSQSARLATSTDSMPNTMQRQTTVDCVRQAVEPQTPLHYMDSGLTDTMKSSTVSSPMSPGEKSISTDDGAGHSASGTRYLNGLPEQSEQHIIIERQVETTEAELQRQQREAATERDVRRESACSQDEHKRLAKKVVEVNIPLSKADKEQQKKDEKERKKAEKEEKERLKREEKERKKAEKEAKKHGDVSKTDKSTKQTTSETTTITTLETAGAGRKQRSSSSSSGSSSDDNDKDGKKKDKKKKHHHHHKDKKNKSSAHTTELAATTYQENNLIESSDVNGNNRVQQQQQQTSSGSGGQPEPESPGLLVSEQRSEHTEDGPVQVTHETDEHGNVITRTRQLHTTTRTVQRQVQYQYEIPASNVDAATDNALALAAGPADSQRQQAHVVHVSSSGDGGSAAETSAAGAANDSQILETRTRTITYEANPGQAGGTQQQQPAAGHPDDPAAFVSSRTVTSGNRTIETVTYKTERDGTIETHVEHRITIHSSADDIDHDAELSSAIMDATKMNPDMTVEKIQVKQETQC